MIESPVPPPVNALSVDVEDYFHAEALRSVAPREAWHGLPSRVERNTDRVIELFARYEVRATFFVLGWIAEHYPGLIRRIAAAGHEIASHGYSHALIYRQSPETFRSETHRARQLVQDLTGQAVDGYRAASFSITPESLWALEILAEAGFRYDSSVFPVHHDLYGLPAAPSAPFQVVTEAGVLTELPLSTLQVAGVRLPASGGGAFRLLPLRAALAMLKRVNRDGAPFVFYMHPWELDPLQPRFKVALRSRIRHYTNLDRFESKLERLFEAFSFAPLAELAHSETRMPDLKPRQLVA